MPPYLRRFQVLRLYLTQQVHIQAGWQQTAVTMIEKMAVDTVMESGGRAYRSSGSRLGQFTSQIVMPHALLELRPFLVANQAMRRIWTETGTAWRASDDGSEIHELSTQETHVMWNDDNAIYDDGEWVTWTEINSHLARLEFEAEYPDLHIELVPIFQKLLAVAESYYTLTGSHLQVYGDLGELYGAITHGIKLHRNYAQGSDGRLGDDLVEVKTITPFKAKNEIELNLKRNFSKVLIVKIDEQFEVQSRMIDRKSLPKVKGGRLKLRWSDFEAHHSAD